MVQVIFCTIALAVLALARVTLGLRATRVEHDRVMPLPSPLATLGLDITQFS
jgi:hypothetical protein